MCSVAENANFSFAECIEGIFETKDSPYVQIGFGEFEEF
jgi:hypothetical protein